MLPLSEADRVRILAAVARKGGLYSVRRVVVITLSLLVLLAVPLTGLARVDLWGGEHRVLGRPATAVHALQGIVISLAVLYGVTFLTNMLFGRFFCGWGCPVGYVSRLGEDVDAPIVQPTITQTQSLFSIPLPGRVGYVFAGLGCPNGCDFCATSHYFKRKHIRLLPDGAAILCAIKRLRQQYPDMVDFWIDRWGQWLAVSSPGVWNNYEVPRGARAAYLKALLGEYTVTNAAQDVLDAADAPIDTIVNEALQKVRFNNPAEDAKVLSFILHQKPVMSSEDQAKAGLVGLSFAAKVLSDPEMAGTPFDLGIPASAIPSAST